MKAQASRGGGLRGAARWLLGGARGALAGVCVATALASVGGCFVPTLSQDGQLVFTPGASRSSAVLLTAEGVEFVDRSEVHTPQVRTSPYDPYQPPRGFLLPREGRFRHIAGPVHFEDEALSVVLRAGEALAPSWGGETLLRLDLTAKGAEEHAPLRFVVILDGPHGALDTLGCQAIAGLLAADRVALIDSRGSRVLLPMVSATERPLLAGVIEHRTIPTEPRDLPGALATARTLLAHTAGEPAGAKVLVLTDGDRLESASDPVKAGVVALEAAGAQVLGVGPGDQLNFPQATPRAAQEISVSLSSSPAPARVVDSSGGKAAALLDADWLFLGHLSAGQGRSEVVRVLLPPFSHGEGYRLEVKVHYTDPASGEERVLPGKISLRYSNDPDEIATYRAADVLGYGSALALVGKLDRAFLGTAATSPATIRGVLEFQERSLLLLGSERSDEALHEQAAVLRSLGWARDLPRKVPTTEGPPKTPVIETPQ